MLRVTLNFDLSKILLCISSQGHDLYSNQKCTFTGSHLRAVTDANDDDDDNAGHHSTTTRVTYHQLWLTQVNVYTGYEMVIVLLLLSAHMTSTCSRCGHLLHIYLCNVLSTYSESTAMPFGVRLTWAEGTMYEIWYIWPPPGKYK